MAQSTNDNVTTSSLQETQKLQKKEAEIMQLARRV